MLQSGDTSYIIFFFPTGFSSLSLPHFEASDYHCSGGLRFAGEYVFVLWSGFLLFTFKIRLGTLPTGWFLALVSMLHHPAPLLRPNVVGLVGGSGHKKCEASEKMQFPNYNSTCWAYKSHNVHWRFF